MQMLDAGPARARLDGRRHGRRRSAAALRLAAPPPEVIPHRARSIRGEEGVWALHETLPGGTLTLASCGVTLRVDELYLKVFDVE